MLRDKFIHYFQQWRERQLSRGEHWLTQHLAGRSPREKGMLLAAAVFLFSAGYYVLIWQPLSVACICWLVNSNGAGPTMCKAGCAG